MADALGWRVQQRGQILVLQKQWIDSRTAHGIWHERGQMKRTWEVMADFGLPSYDIRANPKYRVRQELKHLLIVVV